MIHVVHVIPGLDIGGAETMLLQLVRTLKAPRFKHTVLNMQRHGRLAPVLEASGAHVVNLGMPKGRPSVLGLMRLARAAYREPIDIVQGWMYHGNLGAQALRAIARPQPAAVWSVHNNLSPAKNIGVRMARAVVYANAWGSPYADSIVYVAKSGMTQHLAMGFASERSVHIPGGIDTNDFTPRADGHKALCERLGVSAKTKLIGLVARLHPMKDHVNFFAAARLVTDPTVHFVLVGDRLSDMPESLHSSIDPALQPRLHWMGPQSNVAAVLQGLNVCTLSSSRDEALPRILIEAMACKTPCVATDVGDCDALLHNVGWVVPPRDPEALMRAWTTALECPAEAKEARLERGRARAQSTYSLASMGAQFGALYERLVASP